MASEENNLYHAIKNRRDMKKCFIHLSMWILLSKGHRLPPFRWQFIKIRREVPKSLVRWQRR